MPRIPPPQDDPKPQRLQADFFDRLARAGYDAVAAEKPHLVPWDSASLDTKLQYQVMARAIMNFITSGASNAAGRGEVAAVGRVSAKTGEAYVELHVPRTPMQFTPAMARAIGLMLIESAAESEGDQQFMVYGRDVLGLTQAQAAGFLQQVRAKREQDRGVKAGTA